MHTYVEKNYNIQVPEVGLILDAWAIDLTKLMCCCVDSKHGNMSALK
jgi:hypothetical protein